MKSLLYIATNPIDLEHLGGVEKKILGHCKCFSCFFKTYLINYTACYEVKGDSVNVINTFNPQTKKRRFELFNRALEIAKKEKCNVYVRYPYTDPFFLNLCRKLKSIGCKVIIEIPTYPYRNNHGHTLFSYIRLWADTFFSSFLRRYVDRIVTYSDDKEIFHIKTINTINGIDYGKTDLVQLHGDNNELNLISVAHLYSCHGYDRVIKGLANYCNSMPNRVVNFHIVGEGEVYEDLKHLVTSLRLEKFVFFHGYLSGQDLDKIYNLADVAVNSLAIHRIGLITESTLKAKEYCAKGLPIITAFELDSLSAEDNMRYTYRVPLNDNPIDINSVIRFYDGLRQVPNYNSIIRNHSQMICDMPRTLSPIIAYYKNE